jgi:hypothetical protein
VIRLDSISTLMGNWKRFTNENPDILEALKEGFEVSVYDEETGLIMSQEFVEGQLKVRIIEEAHVIKKRG